MNNIKRGEMFYISRGGVSYNGSEQHSDRPAVVVSNDKNNENSNVVEVVYMTTQPKTDLPTHVTVRSTGRPSTVLCEQVYSVSTERIGTYIGECSDKEMENIDIALMISLQLDGNMKTSKKYNETIKEQQEEIDLYRKKIQAMQEALKEKEKPEITASSEETIRLQTERDTYKTDEQRYSEEQDAIDRETKKKLREMEQEEKMQNLPSDTQETGQKVHQIRLAKSYFDDVANGIKTFELRKNDRGYKKGDILEMMEFADGKNTGRMVKVLVTYILEDYTGIEDGYCIMATKLMKDGEA